MGVHSVRARTPKPARVAPQRRWRAAAAVTAMLAPLVLTGDATFAWVNTAHTTPMNQPKPPPQNPLGATGQLPQDPDPQIGDPANTPDADAAAFGLPNGPLGIPSAALEAYKRAEQLEAARNPNCHLDWPLLAGIGRIESNHARGGAVDAAGNTLSPILGPVLDGSGGFAMVPDTDHGVWDGNTQWDRAVGPMQFIPQTWQQYAAVSNAKSFGSANPNNIYDSAYAAANYLCAGGGDMRDPAARSAAVYGYNHSDAYVANVLAWATSYATGVASLPNDTIVPFVQPSPIGPYVGPPPPPPPVNTGGGGANNGGGGDNGGTNGGDGSTTTSPTSTTTSTSTSTSTSTTTPGTSSSTTPSSPPSSTPPTSPSSTTPTTTPVCPTPTTSVTPSSSVSPTTPSVPPGCPTPTSSTPPPPPSSTSPTPSSTKAS
ncbi:lytic transglycosylase domain-containing protein [Kutzneria buriramensis]|uniref:Membrane-bound lytic murein transglycosylase B n=1 Tax=Kutzneria buriramensis TaxID=1045776 RepID=A0A3E0HCX9_9PSEU|nr:lytic murein transglycosylase [Kutzneria buriramensis]REH41839.1 hypothetical protein BCF44_111142 [Kutzneria buriramensis]